MKKHDFSNEIQNAYNHFYGFFKGVSASINIEPPETLYYYVPDSLFSKIIDKNEMRFYAINKYLDNDYKERKVKFSIEDKSKFEFVDNKSGLTYDITKIFNDELSSSFVFIKSLSYELNNQHLWKKYANDHSGVCLAINTSKFIEQLNSLGKEFSDLPSIFKCLYIDYNQGKVFSRHLEACLKAVTSMPTGSFKSSMMLILPFYIDYLRTFIKQEKYSPEKECRLVISNYYSFFLKVLSVISKWPKVITFKGNKLLLSESFNKEHQELYKDFSHRFNLMNDESSKYVTLPLSDLVDSIYIGLKSSFKANILREKFKNIKIEKY